MSRYFETVTFKLQANANNNKAIQRGYILQLVDVCIAQKFNLLMFIVIPNSKTVFILSIIHYS